MLAAPRIVRMDFAVRPCLPITLPRSLCATRSSSTVASPSSTGVTLTSAGVSTSAWAICSTKARISPAVSAISPSFSSQLLGPYDFCSRRPEPALSGRGTCRGWRFGEQTAYRIGKLRTLGNPVVDAIAFQINGRGVGAGVIQPHHFHFTAVARPLLLNHHHAIIRLFARTNARQSEH